MRALAGKYGSVCTQGRWLRAWWVKSATSSTSGATPSTSRHACQTSQSPGTSQSPRPFGSRFRRASRRRIWAIWTSRGKARSRSSAFALRRYDAARGYPRRARTVAQNGLCFEAAKLRKDLRLVRKYITKWPDYGLYVDESGHLQIGPTAVGRQAAARDSP